MEYLKETGLTGSELRPVLMADLEFAAGGLYVHTGFGELEYAGHTYTGVGAFGSISSAQSGAELSRQTITATLSGIPIGALDLAEVSISGNYQGRSAEFNIAMLDERFEVSGDRVNVYDGRMDVAVTRLGADATVEMTVENYLSDWDRSRQSLYTDAEQQRLYPGDRFFEFVPQMETIELPWGVRD